MEVNKFVLATMICLALCESTQAKRSEDVLPPRPSRNKNSERITDRQELFAGLKDPEPSAQGVSAAITPYNQLGNQGGFLNAGGGVYAGGVGQTQNPYNLGLGGLGGSGLQQSPYLGLGGLGGFQQNPYLGGIGVGTYQQVPYSLGTGGIGGFNGLGLQTQYLGIQNPYLQAGGLQDIYSQQVLAGGLGNQYLGVGGFGGGATGANPFQFRNQGQGLGYLGQNNYLGQGSYLSQGLLNPYTSYGQLNPYNSYPLSSRFGLGLSRGAGAGRTSSSQQTSNSDE